LERSDDDLAERGADVELAVYANAAEAFCARAVEEHDELRSEARNDLEAGRALAATFAVG